MKEFSTSLKEKLKNIDYIIISCAFALSLLSILVLWGGSANFQNGKSKVIVQSVAVTLGLILAFLISTIDYDTVIEKLEKFFFIFSIAMLLGCLVINKFFPSISGATGSTNQNWIKIPGVPFYMQPAEFVKITFIITFSRHIDRVGDKINNPLNVLKLLIHAGIIIGILAITKDLGTVLIYMFIMAAMLFVGGLSLWYFVGFAVIMVIVFPFLWDHMKEYQQQRIIVGFNPESDPEDYGYQALLSKKAIINGGFRGAGLTGGTVYTKLPAAHSDFLFAVLAEKLGFFGTFAYICIMAGLVVRLLIVSRRTRKDYASLICVGVAAMLIAQTLENIGMCLAALPVIGIPLPFFSYGGSSMLALYISLGVVESICSHSRKYYFEREPSSQSLN